MRYAERGRLSSSYGSKASLTKTVETVMSQQVCGYACPECRHTCMIACVYRLMDGYRYQTHTRAHTHIQGWSQGQGETGQEEEAGAEQTRKTPPHGADKADATAPAPDDARSLLMQRNLRRLAEVEC